MRIQWNSGAAQEVLERLRKADRGADECLQQSVRVRSELNGANAEGDDRALVKLTERFEECNRKLEKLIAALEEFEAAVRKADVEFEDAEKRVAHALDGVDETASAPVYVAPNGGDWDTGSWGSSGWGPGAYVVMPDMRVRVAQVPLWLEAMTAQTSAI